MRNRLKQYYSILLNKKPNVFMALALAFIILATILIGGILMNIIGGGGIKGIKDSVYQAMLMIIDPGFLAVDKGFIIGTISLLIVLFGMIVFLGGSIGYISTVLSNFMDNVRGGSKNVYLCDHMLILNWNSRVLDIFAEECYRGETKNILILVKEGREEIDEQLHNKRALLKKEGGSYHHVNCFVREGDLYSSHEILEAGVERASTIVILDDDTNCTGTSELASMGPIKILMLLSKMNLSKEQSIIVESVDSWTKDLIEDIKAESEGEILGVSTNEILGKMLAQMSIMPELNEVYSELMSYKGNEFYSLVSEFPADDKYTGIEDYMDSHAYGIPLNIMDVEGQSHLFVMGDDIREVKLDGANKPEIIDISINKEYRQSKRNIVIIGKNSKQNYIYDCYAQYVTEHGSDSLHIYRISTEEGLEMVRDKHYISEYEIEDDYDKEGIKTHLRTILHEEKIDTVLILSNDMDDGQELDTEALVDLINVKRMVMETDHDPELVVEILDPRHIDIASRYGIKSIVFSNQYVSRLITQFGDSSSLYTFFADLFEYDTNKEEMAAGIYRSKEIYIRKASEVFHTLPPQLSWRNLMASVYYSSTKENPLIMLGYIRGQTDELILFGENMDKKTVELEAEDKIVIYCRH